MTGLISQQILTLLKSQGLGFEISCKGSNAKSIINLFHRGISRIYSRQFVLTTDISGEDDVIVYFG